MALTPTPVADGLWTVDKMQKLGPGFTLPLRTTVMTLGDGSVLLYGPIRMTDELAGEIRRIGPVRHAVAPNLLHHLWLGRVRDHFPDAALWGPPGLGQQRKDLDLAGELEADAPPPWGAGARPIRWAGERFVRETLLHHEGSNSLVAGDVFMNVHEADGWVGPLAMKLEGCWKQPGVPRLIRWLPGRDRDAMAASAAAVRETRPDRIVPAHGRITDTDVEATLDRALAPVL